MAKKTNSIEELTENEFEMNGLEFDQELTETGNADNLNTTELLQYDLVNASGLDLNMEPPTQMNHQPVMEQGSQYPLEQTTEEVTVTPARRTRRKQAVLTIDNTSQQPQLAPEDLSWHEIQSAARTRKILTGVLSGIEQLENGSYIAVIYYKEIRIIIPMNEMMIELTGTEEESAEEIAIRQSKISNSMLGSDVDFVVRGTDSKTHSAVASRREAMLRKRRLFYGTRDAGGQPRIDEGSIVEARIVAVTDKVVRAEVFGVECTIPPRELSWDWMGNAKERFDVGNHVRVKILKVENGNVPETVRIQASIKDVIENTVLDNLKKCKVQGKYAGKVTDIIRGNVHIRLSIGVNAIAQACNDPRMPGKKDDVSFVVTRIDENRGIALGIITRIIRQNI